MKIAFMASMIAAYAGYASADGTQKPAMTAETIAICDNWGRFAELAMSAHQQGKPLSDQMGISPDPRAYELTFEAYQTERFSDDARQSFAVAAFRDATVSECIVSLTDPDAAGAKRPREFWNINKP